MLTQGRLKELFFYDQNRGDFIRLIRAGHEHPGAVAGSMRDDGYREVGVDGTYYLAHRLAFLYMLGRWPNPEADHINGLKNDNRWTNLREATRVQNCRNKRKRVDSQGPHKNTRREMSGKFSSRICIEKGKYLRLGIFDTAEEAVAAYKIAADKYFGDFAKDPSSVVVEVSTERRLNRQREYQRLSYKAKKLGLSVTELRQAEKRK